MNKLSPFKWFVLQNFPFIEADFDALTNYELMCKIVEYLNETIAKTNELGNQVETLTNWFNNLDVQEEVNNKLDEMAESGELSDMIAQYLQLAGVLAYDTKADMKSAENLIAGSICKTLGSSSYSDGDGHFYRVRQILNTDVIDDNLIIALHNTNLVAERIPDSTSGKRIIVIGDSYSKHDFEDITKFWYEYFAEYLGLTLNTDLYVKASDGAGFSNDAFYNRLYELRNTIPDSEKADITDILIVGGLNDRNSTEETLLSKMSAFNTYARATYPNAKITIAYVGNTNPKIRQTTENYVGVLSSRNSYTINAGKLGWSELKNTCYILHNYGENYWEDDGAHPSQLGQTNLGIEITNAFINGSCDIVRQIVNTGSYTTAIASGIATAISNRNFISGIENETSFLKKTDSGAFYFNVNDTQMNCAGNTAYEIATLSDGYYMGNGSQSGTTVPIFLSGTIGGNTNTRAFGYANIYVEYGKLYIKPCVFYNNSAVQNSPIQYVYIPAFQIISPSYYA